VSDGADKKKKKPQNKNLCLYPDRSCKPPKGDAFVEDFQIKLARDLLAEAKTWRRSQILASSGPLLKRVRAEQQKRVADAMKKLGLDWSKANGATGEPRLAVKVSTDPTGPARACKLMRLKVTVKNVGTAPTARLRAVTGSSNGLFDKHELVFGRIEPGATRSWEVPIKIRDAPTRTDDVVIKFHGAGKAKHQPFRFQMSVKGVERPVYSYSYQLIDDIKGNLDGQAQRGEEVRLFMRVRNKGKGPAFRTVAQLKDLSGPGIFIRKGRFNLGRLNPGQEKTASFTLWVKPNYSQKNFKLELTVLEDGLREYVSEKLVFPVAEDAQTVSAAKGTVKVSGGHAALRAWANKKAPLVGIAKRGASFKLLGKIGKWYRVMAPQSQIAFVSAKKMATVSGTARPKMIPKWQVSPPKITLQIPSHVTKKSTFKLKGIATDETQISDVYIFVRNREAKIDGRKIFYRSNRKSRTPRRLSFEVDVPLWEGANYITVFARESEDTRAQQTVVISRRKTNRVARKIDKRQP
jgi:carboxyl-terminal processing protease